MKRFLAIIVLIAFAPHGPAYGQDAQTIADDLRHRAERIASFEVEFEHVLTNVRDDGEPLAPVRTRLVARADDHRRITVRQANADGEFELMQDQSRIDGVMVDLAPPRDRATIVQLRQPTHLVITGREFPLLVGRIFDRAELTSATLDDNELLLRWANPHGVPSERDIIARFAAEAPYSVQQVTLGEDLDDAPASRRIQFAGDDALERHDLALPGHSRELILDQDGEVRLRLDSSVREAKVNEELPDDAFEVELPDDVDVIDRRDPASG